MSQLSASKKKRVDTPHQSAEIIYDFITPAEESYLIDRIDAEGGSDREGGSKKSGGWTDLNGRRSMYWGGTVTKKQILIPSPMPSFMMSAWPNVCERIANTGAFKRLEGKGDVISNGPNHCLVNEYLPGQGIMPHTDGPAYEPIVATLSLGSHVILHLFPCRPLEPIPDRPEDGEREELSHLTSEFTICLPRRSLLILSEELYSDYLHGIQPVEKDMFTSLKKCRNWGEILKEPFRAEDVMDTMKKENGRTTPIDGLWRTRRISLTCRSVGKVSKGIRIG